MIRAVFDLKPKMITRNNSLIFMLPDWDTWEHYWKQKLETNGVSVLTNLTNFYNQIFVCKHFDCKKVTSIRWRKCLNWRKIVRKSAFWLVRCSNIRYVLSSLSSWDWGVLYTLLSYTAFQQLKPSILRDISEETQLAPQPPRFNFVDDDDKLILEDELQRIRLVGKLDVHYMVTGVVCAILGECDSRGAISIWNSIFF